MTYIIYSQQQLQLKSIARLKQIYNEIACTVEVSDKRCKDSWISAIVNYQSSKIQKVTSTALDEQALAQAELDNYIADQAQAIAPEELTTLEISFYDHEIYCGKELIASITSDDDLTQPWVVMVDGKEKFRANTWARCHRFIQWHHQDSTLNEATPAATETPCTTENVIMAHIFNECQNYGFEILGDGIYNNNGVKLGQVGCTNGNWWVKRRYSVQQQYSNSVYDAVRSLSMVDTSLAEPVHEYLQDQPLEQLTTDELQQLLSAQVASCEQLLDRPVDELTSQDWERLREYEPYLELVAA
ncbi:hypothetical protein A4S05_15155 [Nostoc sp. KVJ20]|uniref:hypothetical protein n=1 Tax=unclassified Nostoc TaxID=2593658 RepID=UPI00086C15A6|nr:hypothetical protein [Nostoc sp. KVJ20]ODG97072.1 hypothetical protein A4S05_15155 [Nostoc sp. KVJ20]